MTKKKLARKRKPNPYKALLKHLESIPLDPDYYEPIPGFPRIYDLDTGTVRVKGDSDGR